MSTSDRQAHARAAARAAEQQARARARQSVRIAVVATGLVALAGLVGVFAGTVGDEPAGPAAAGPADTGLRRTPPPWPAQPDGLDRRLAGLAFPPVGDESYHAHVQLDVYRHGQQVQVPAGIGFDRAGGHSSLHTHTADGVVHMEADDPYPYTLQEFFTVWGVAFDTDRLGADTAGSGGAVFVYVNGAPAPDGPVPLRDRDRIVVAFGAPGSHPTEAPALAPQPA